MMTELEGQWTVNPKCRRRTSSNGISLVFIPGQNVVLELNAVAGSVLDAFSGSCASYQAVRERLRSEYEVDDLAAFEAELQQLMSRFVRHDVVVRGGAADVAAHSVR